jgi:hypothetical protein
MSDNLPAVQFNKNIRYVVIDGTTYFSVFDVFQYYGESGNPRRDWQRVRERLTEQSFDVVPNLVQHQFKRSDGKRNRSTPVATLNTFLRIAMVANIKTWEALRQWMANVAEAQINPEPSRISKTSRQAILDYTLEGVAAHVLPLVLQTEALLSKSLTEMLFVVSDEYYKVLIKQGLSQPQAIAEVQSAITKMAPQVVNEVILKELVRLGMTQEKAILRLQIAAPLIAGYIAHRNQQQFPAL